MTPLSSGIAGIKARRAQLAASGQGRQAQLTIATIAPTAPRVDIEEGLDWPDPPLTGADMASGDDGFEDMGSITPDTVPPAEGPEPP